MSKSRPHGHVCAFCAADVADVELMFVSEQGGLPPEICSACVEGFMAVLDLHRRHPGLAERMIQAHNALVDKARRA